MAYPLMAFRDLTDERHLKKEHNLAGGLMDQRYSGIYLQDELGFVENKLGLPLQGGIPI